MNSEIALKVNFKRIGNVFMHCLSFFYYFAKELMRISGTRIVGSGGQCLLSRLWPAGSFA